MQFSGVVPERWLESTGKVYRGRPLPRRTREELLVGIRPDWQEAIARARAGASARSRLLVVRT
jgi:hypothetical protein